MTITALTTSRFTSAAAAGPDWRAVARTLLAALGTNSPKGEPAYTLGFLYVTDILAENLEALLAALREATGIKDWAGTVGVGVCANGRLFTGQPAACVLLGRFEPESYRPFPVTDPSLADVVPVLEPWLDVHEPLLMLVHGDPQAPDDPAQTLLALEGLSGAFIAGGLASSRWGHPVIAGHAQPDVFRDVARGGVGGVAFSADVPVATTLTQGCTPIGHTHTITRCNGTTLLELDGRPALEVFAADMKTMLHQQPKEGLTIHLAGEEPPHPAIENLFQGEIHVAFPVPGSDQNDYMVRNIAALDPDSGQIVITAPLEPGQHLLFVRRDEKTIETDLIRALTALRARLIRENGVFAPQAGLYISCLGRMAATKGKTGEQTGGELQILHSVLGDIPLAGFYAGGEISNRRLYGYTGVLILFL